MAAKKKKLARREAPSVRGVAKKMASKPEATGKVTVKKGPSAKKEAPPSSADVISQIIAKVNTAHGGAVVRRASEASTEHTLRRPTGIPALDIDLAGGWPAGSLNVLTGPDGAGKDLLINMSIAENQKNYGENSRVAILSTEFPYDKNFAREKCGVKVADTPEEIAQLNSIRMANGEPPLTAEEVAIRKEQIGEIILIQGVVMDYGLDIVLELLSSGQFQIIAINSFGVMQTAAKEEVESVSEHAIQSNEAQLLSRFIPRMFMLLNTVLPDGERNETTLLAADQVRANRDMPRGKPGMKVPEHWKYQAGSGSRALAHGKAISLMLHKGAPVLDKQVDPPEMLGREINWELTKGKLGTHDGLKGSFEFFFAEGVDRPSSLRNVALRYSVIEQAGAWYSYTDANPDLSFRVQGGDPCRSKLTDPEIYAAVLKKTLSATGLFFRVT